MGQNTFLNSKTFQKIDFFAKKTSKMRLQIHENQSKIQYEKLSLIFFDFGGMIAMSAGGGVHPTSKDGSSPPARLAGLLAGCRLLGPHVGSFFN